MEVLLVLIGVVIGIVGTLVYFARLSMGTLRIDNSDPTDVPYLFLEIDEGKTVDSIVNKKRVLFVVEKKNFISESN